MTGEQSLRQEDQGASLAWRIGGGIGVAAYVVLSLAYVFLGRLNADEGWYLLASRLVYSGQIPYSDYAYTQTPLLPYIYGIPQLVLSPSVMLGRATSAAFSMSAFVMWLFIVRKRSGVLGASVTALLLATFTTGIYHNSIVKTYALVTFLFTMTFFLMTVAPRRKWFALLAAVTALAAVLVRLSALPFAIVIIGYLLLSPRPKPVKLAIGILTAALMAGFLLLIRLDSQAAIWNLVGYHTVEQNGIPLILNLDTFLVPCGSAALAAFLPYVVLWLLSLLFIKRQTGKLDEFGRLVLVFVAGVGLYAGASFVAGNCYIEYLVPAVYVLLPFFAMSFALAYQQQRFNLPRNALLRIVLFAILISEAARGGWQFVDLSGGQLPLVELGQVADQVRALTSPSDRVLALQSLWVAVEADRQVLPGLTMAQFSIYEGSTEQARRLKLVNDDIILDYLNSGAAKVVVFTDEDWETWRKMGISDGVESALLACYESPAVRGNFGQYGRRVYLYARRPVCQS